MKFDIGASCFSVHTFGLRNEYESDKQGSVREGDKRGRGSVLTARISAVAGQSGLHALIAGLLGRGRSTGGSGALTTRRCGRNERFFIGVALVYVSREEIAEVENLSVSESASGAGALEHGNRGKEGEGETRGVEQTF
jgi:hypothetical protein